MTEEEIAEAIVNAIYWDADYPEDNDFINDDADLDAIMVCKSDWNVVSTASRLQAVNVFVADKTIEELAELLLDCWTNDASWYGDGNYMHGHSNGEICIEGWYDILTTVKKLKKLGVIVNGDEDK